MKMHAKIRTNHESKLKVEHLEKKTIKIINIINKIKYTLMKIKSMKRMLLYTFRKEDSKKLVVTLVHGSGQVTEQQVIVLVNEPIYSVQHLQNKPITRCDRDTSDENIHHKD